MSNVAQPASRARDARLARRGATLSLVSTLLLALCACRPDPTIVVDLTAALVDATVSRERGRIDIGTPEARPVLRTGFSYNERTPDGRSFVWGSGVESELELFSVAPRALTLEVSCRAHLDGQVVDVEVNDVVVGSWTLGRRWSRYRVEIPADVPTPGPLRIVFRYTESSDPALVPRTRVAWDWVRLHGAFDPEPPRRLELEGGRGAALELDAGTQIDYFLSLEAPTTLHVESVSGEGVEVIVRRDDGADRVERLLDSARIPVSTAAEAVQLTLRLPADPGGGEATVRLAAPYLVSATPRDANSAVATSRAAATREGANVLIFLIDTLRRDHVGCFGSQRRLTPVFDELCGRSFRFTNAVAQSSWTKPAVASTLTGLWPSKHGSNLLDSVLPDELVTLPEILSHSGYETVGFSTNWHIRDKTGFSQGFDELVFDPEDGASAPAFFASWLESRPDKAPFFAYLHIIEPHAPYEPPDDLRLQFAPEARADAGSVESIRALYPLSPEERRGALADVELLYDADVAAADRLLGQTLRTLEEHDLTSDTIVVVLSDHGEEFDEHGSLGHGQNLYGHTTDIPLAIYVPWEEGGEIVDLAQHVDVLPTLLALVVPETPPLPIDGVDLLTPSKRRQAFAYLDYNGKEGASVTTHDHRSILPLTRLFGTRAELFARGDREELSDLSPHRPVLQGTLQAWLRRELRHGDDTVEMRTELSDEAKRRLEALGYL